MLFKKEYSSFFWVENHVLVYLGFASLLLIAQRLRLHLRGAPTIRTSLGFDYSSVQIGAKIHDFQKGLSVLQLVFDGVDKAGVVGANSLKRKMKNQKSNGDLKLKDEWKEEEKKMNECTY